MRLHIKVGTHPAYFVVVQKKKPPKIGERLILKNGNKTIHIQCSIIKNLGDNDILYYMDLM